MTRQKLFLCSVWGSGLWCPNSAVARALIEKWCIFIVYSCSAGLISFEMNWF